MRKILLIGAVLVGLISRAAPVSSGTGPRIRACIWIGPTGEARMPDGMIYRITDSKGRPFAFKEPVALTVLDTGPEAKR